MKKLMNRDYESHLLEGKSVRVANVPHCFIMHYKIITNTAYFGNSTNSKVVGRREILLKKSKCALTICLFLLFTSVILSQSFLVSLLSVFLAV